MASSLTFTSGPFMQATIATASASANTRYTILSSDATNARRIYGISIGCTYSAGAQTITTYLNDGTTAYQAFQLSMPINSGNTTTAAAVDLIGNVYGAAIFQKQRDANGVPYFNLPAGWSIQYAFNTALTGTNATIWVIVFGETYA